MRYREGFRSSLDLTCLKGLGHPSFYYSFHFSLPSFLAGKLHRRPHPPPRHLIPAMGRMGLSSSSSSRPPPSTRLQQINHQASPSKARSANILQAVQVRLPFEGYLQGIPICYAMRGIYAMR